MSGVQFAQVTEVYDLNTIKGQLSVLKFHSPSDGLVPDHLAGFMMQFRRYQYNGCSVGLFPATTLPLDPLAVSYEAGEPTVDPRDILNPIVHRPYRGEYIATDSLDWNASGELHGNKGLELGTTPLVGTAGSSVVETAVPLISGTVAGRNAEVVYGNLLMDSSWKKSHIQRALTFTGVPLVRPMASNHQIMDFARTDVPQLIGTGASVKDGIPAMGPYGAPGPQDVWPDASGGAGAPETRYGNNLGLAGQVVWQAGTGNLVTRNAPHDMFTHGFQKLGWMDTVNLVDPRVQSGGTVNDLIPAYRQSKVRIPKVYMHVMVLPPAYKQNMYYRLMIKHKFAFKSFRTTRELSREYLEYIAETTASSEMVAPVEIMGAELKAIATGAEE